MGSCDWSHKFEIGSSWICRFSLKLICRLVNLNIRDEHINLIRLIPRILLTGEQCEWIHWNGNVARSRKYHRDRWNVRIHWWWSRDEESIFINVENVNAFEWIGLSFFPPTNASGFPADNGNLFCVADEMQNLLINGVFSVGGRLSRMVIKKTVMDSSELMPSVTFSPDSAGT